MRLCCVVPLSLSLSPSNSLSLSYWSTGPGKGGVATTVRQPWSNRTMAATARHRGDLQQQRSWQRENKKQQKQEHDVGVSYIVRPRARTRKRLLQLPGLPLPDLATASPSVLHACASFSFTSLSCTPPSPPDFLCMSAMCPFSYSAFDLPSPCSLLRAVPHATIRPRSTPTSGKQGWQVGEPALWLPGAHLGQFACAPEWGTQRTIHSPKSSMVADRRVSPY